MQLWDTLFILFSSFSSFSSYYSSYSYIIIILLFSPLSSFFSLLSSCFFPTNAEERLFDNLLRLVEKRTKTFCCCSASAKEEQEEEHLLAVLLLLKCLQFAIYIYIYIYIYSVRTAACVALHGAAATRCLHPYIHIDSLGGGRVLLKVLYR